jgi:hypothetical protein
MARCFGLALIAVASAIDSVDLGVAGKFAVLTKSGITNTPQSVVSGHIGVSPIAATAMTGFTLIQDPASTQYSKSTQVTGRVYAPGYSGDTPSMLTTAVLNMQAAYTDAAGRSVTDTTGAYNDVKSGLIAGSTFTAGVYNWGTDVLITEDITISGGDNDKWIFQMTGSLNVATNKKMNLLNTNGDGPQAANIVWQVAKSVNAGAGAHLEGILLVATSVALNTGASLNGRILCQTAATLGMATVVAPDIAEGEEPPMGAAGEANTIENTSSNNTSIIIGVVVGVVALVAIIAAAVFYTKYRAAAAAAPKATLPMTNVAIAPADVTVTQATPNAQPPRAAARGWFW